MSACRLHEAAKANRVKELERLLDQGYHVDLVEGGFTALYLAVEAGKTTCIVNHCHRLSIEYRPNKMI